MHYQNLENSTMEQTKKVPLLFPAPAPPKPKKETKTYCFEVVLLESNDKTYPEFSWKDLVHEADVKAAKEKAESGVPLLNPYASDDEDDLKAMAARLEAKYSSSPSVGKMKERHKRREEDFIDKGAGYDETDSFIDNSDIYDELVPLDLQPEHGGFYINSGALDFTNVDISEDEEPAMDIDENGSNKNNPGPGSSKVGSDTNVNVDLTNHAIAVIKQVSRAVSVEDIRAELPSTGSSNSNRPKGSQKRRGSNSSSTGSSSTNTKQVTKRIKLVKKLLPKIPNNGNNNNANEVHQQAPKEHFRNPIPTQSRSNSPHIVKPSTTTISITSSSEDETTNSETSEEDDDDTTSTQSSESTGNNTTEVLHKLDHTNGKKKVDKLESTDITIIRKPLQMKKDYPLPALYPIAVSNVNISASASLANAVNTQPPLPRKLKVKNVPLNPKLHGDLNGVSALSMNSRAVDSLKSTGDMKGVIGPLPSTLTQRQNNTANNATNMDVFIGKVSLNDNNNPVNLPKPPTLTPAPTVRTLSSGNTSVISQFAPVTAPPMKKLTNRMSCGSVMRLQKRKSDGSTKPQGASSISSKSNIANSKSLTGLNNISSSSKLASSSSDINTISSNITTSGAKTKTVIVTQNTFNKIRKPRQRKTEQNVTHLKPASGEFLRQADLKLNPKHGTSVLQLSSTTSTISAQTAEAQLLQMQQLQVQLLAAVVSSSNSLNYHRQSPINTMPSMSMLTAGTNIAAAISSNKIKPARPSPNTMYTSVPPHVKNLSISTGVSGTEGKVRNRPSSSTSGSYNSSSSARSSSSTNLKRSSNSNTPTPSVFPFVNYTAAPAFNHMYSNSLAQNSVNSVISSSKQQSYSKHITPYDVNALLSLSSNSNNNKK